MSYKIVGVLFEVIKLLGGDYQEKYYQRAIEKLFIRDKINFKRELPVDIYIDDEKIGRHFLDFLVEDSVVLEIKKGNTFRIGDVKQVLMYLKSTNKQLGILAYFNSNGVNTKRIINKEFRDNL